MKKVIKHNNLYGDILYKEGFWRKVEPLQCEFNNSIIGIQVDLVLIESAYIEYELGISNLILEYSTPEMIEESKNEYIKYGKKVEKMYKQYLININDIMKKVEEIIINDYARYRKEWTEEEIKKYNTPSMAKKILKVSTPEEILKIVKIKHIIVYDNRVVIELKCPWYPQSDAGMVLDSDGNIQIGLGEMMQ